MVGPGRRGRRRATVENSAGGVVVRTIDDSPHALLIRDPYGKWGLPKGHVEAEETPRDTALREVREETGLTDVRLGEELATVDWYFGPEGARVHKFATFFLMFSDDGEPSPEIEEGITECAWIPLEEAADRISYDNARRVAEAAWKTLAGSDASGEGNGR